MKQEALSGSDAREARAEMGVLSGVRICLVFDFSLSHYTRLLTEIRALQDAGASISLLSEHPNPQAPTGVAREQTQAAFSGDLTRQDKAPHPWIAWALRPKRRLMLKGLRKAIVWSFSALRWARGLIATRRYRRLVQGIARRVDAFWVIDFPRLESIIKGSRRSKARVIYETVDLVPEYQHYGATYRRRSLSAERRLIPQVHGFITASESYADYYVERYSLELIGRRPIVRDNAPADQVKDIVPTGARMRFLFLGSLMFDRPIFELVEAFQLVTSDVSLTIQGKDYLDPTESARLQSIVRTLAGSGRVDLAEACPPESIVETASTYDVGIVALRGTDENERRAPTGKLFTYMAAGLAVLAVDLPGIAAMVRAHQNGVLVQGMDPNTWADAIDKMAAAGPDVIDSMKRRSLEAATTYSWEMQRGIFVNEFYRVVGRTSATVGSMPVRS